MQSLSSVSIPQNPLFACTKQRLCAESDACGVAPEDDPQGHRGAHAEGGALKLDTWTLTGNNDHNKKPKHVPYSEKAVYKDRPINFPVYEKPYAFRVKIQDFGDGGYEATVSSVNLQKHSDIASLRLPRGARTERKGDDESHAKSIARSKRKVRIACKVLGADHLITFTTREDASSGYRSLDQLMACFAKVTDLLNYHLKRKFEYVCVPENHPTNPEHIHLHVAIRGALTPREMVIFRRCWYIALGGKGTERGNATPGGFNIKYIKASKGSSRMRDKIASYISKYITKDCITGFNRKRYWSSRIDIPEARSYWLHAQTIGEAFGEFVLDFKFDHALEKGDFFQARNIDLLWFRYVPSEVLPDCPF